MEVRDYESGDELQILNLFNTTFRKPMSEAYWKWRFLDNPENKTMIKLMWDNDRLVGHYAVSPLKLNINNESILTALSMSTMTHPDYAGRGIFTDLAEALYTDETKKNGLKAVWGFPNNNSHYGFIKNLNWVNLEQIPTFSINVEKIKETNHSSVFVISAFSSSHINAKTTTNSSISIEKNIDYLNWRYIMNPINNYDIFEMKNRNSAYYAVTKIFQSFTDKNTFEVDILELVFPHDYDSLLELMNAIKNHYKQYELSKINTWLPLNDKKHLQLEKIGFVNSLPITYFGLRILDENYTQLENSSNWLYSMGDSDIY